MAIMGCSGIARDWETARAMCSKIDKEVCRVQLQLGVLFAGWFMLLLVKQNLIAD